VMAARCLGERGFVRVVLGVRGDGENGEGFLDGIRPWMWEEDFLVTTRL
jgi:hypothetical protein